MLSIVAGAATSAGRVRTVNEDRYLLGTSVFAVADGMGGHAAGERASALVIEYLAEVSEGRRARPDEVVAAIANANEAIVHEADEDVRRHGMGTTLVGLSLTELSGSPHWLVFNVGDSRLYSWNGQDLRQLTVDHSEVQELIESGEISAEEADEHPRRHVITRSVGTRPQPVIDTWVLPFDELATFLICSDGLTAEISVEQIQRLLRSSSTPQVAADRLVQAAEEAGGRDNVTVLVVKAAPDTDSGSGVEVDTTPRGAPVIR